MDTHFVSETNLPTVYGTLRVRSYRDDCDDTQLALIVGNPTDGCVVRAHSECLTGEALGSLKCDCGPQLHAALERISREGGVVLYLRGQEGRGIGLANKLRAYALQEQGMDTVDANVALGLPIDARDYRAAADILRDLGLRDIKLLTNNPAKIEGLEQHGIRVSERLPLEVARTPESSGYLATKAKKLGHLLTGSPSTGPARASQRKNWIAQTAQSVRKHFTSQ